jgi:hypothetical protein
MSYINYIISGLMITVYIFTLLLKKLCYFKIFMKNEKE